MEIDDFETTIKVIVVGNGGVGKTSMTALYCKNKYTDEYKKTIGVDFMEKTIEVDDLGETVKLMIWDTAGQEEFDSLTSRYYKGAGAAVLVFSTTDRDSFDAIRSWRAKVEAECGSIPMTLVQNKIDLMDKATMTPEEVEGLARSLQMRLYRTCVKDNMNVGNVFEYLTARYFDSGGRGNESEAIDTIAEHQPAVAGAQSSVAAPAAAQAQPTDEADGVQPFDAGDSSDEDAVQDIKKPAPGDAGTGPNSPVAHDRQPAAAAKPPTTAHASSAQAAEPPTKVVRKRIARDGTKARSELLDLEPEVRRTGGKKAGACTIQ